MIGSTVTVHADEEGVLDRIAKTILSKIAEATTEEEFVISHFADAHETIDFFEDATVELPSDWLYSAQDDNTISMFPLGDESFVIVLSRSEYDPAELNGVSFDDTLLLAASDAVLTGMAGEDVGSDSSEITTLDNGNTAAIGAYLCDDNETYCLDISTVYGDYLYALGAVTTLDIMEDEQYFDDLVAIISSIKEA